LLGPGILKAPVDSDFLHPTPTISHSTLNHQRSVSFSGNEKEQEVSFRRLRTENCLLIDDYYP
jgi:hypothetical protein